MTGWEDVRLVDVPSVDPAVPELVELDPVEEARTAVLNGRDAVAEPDVEQTQLPEVEG